MMKLYLTNKVEMIKRPKVSTEHVNGVRIWIRFVMKISKLAAAVMLESKHKM